jgi:hypothetical protein
VETGIICMLDDAIGLDGNIECMLWGANQMADLEGSICGGDFFHLKKIFNRKLMRPRLLIQVLINHK